MVKGVAEKPFTRSQESMFQRNNEHKVNGTLSLRQHIHNFYQYW